MIANNLFYFYLNYNKYILYCELTNNVWKSIIYKISYILMYLFAPIIPFIMEKFNDNKHFILKIIILIYHNLYNSPIYTEGIKNDKLK